MTDISALFKIGYGLYVVTSNDGKKLSCNWYNVYDGVRTFTTWKD